MLQGISLEVPKGQVVTLIGSNGAGKTTQLRVLAGELDLDEGEVGKSSADLSISFLRQEFREDLREGRSLRDELTSVFAEIEELNAAYAQWEVDPTISLHPTWQASAWCPGTGYGHHPARHSGINQSFHGPTNCLEELGLR